MSSVKNLNVLLDTAVLPQSHGGLATATLGLVNALGKLEGPETYHLAVDNDEQLEWIAPHKGENQRIADKGRWLRTHFPKNYPSGPRKMASKMLRPVTRTLRSLHRRLHTEPAPWPQVPLSDGF
ncbi:MAG TPA: hypothetical protein VFJ90_08990, partial [Candidatus Didemnitutus sp.]|nr:hypothetical protein [Candidatus Didemnitutus sp.]